MKNKRSVRGVKRFLACQLGITLMAAGVSWVTAGKAGALSALLGGLVGVIPNAYFAHKLFKCQHARAAKQIMRSVYQGEALKIMLSIALFAIVFMCFHVMPAVFFITYIAVQLVFWLAPWLFF